MSIQVHSRSDLLAMAACTVSVPMPRTVSPNELDHALLLRAGRLGPSATLLRSFLEEVHPNLIHEIVLSGGPSFEHLNEIARATEMADGETRRWLEEMAFLELACSSETRNPSA